jgi:Uma2 family endonuclease
LSCEPDLTFVSNESFDAERVKLTPKEERPSDAVEIVGPPDLVVEIVSDSSVTKDTQDLYRLYFEAGVCEYWLIDARGEEISFSLLVREPSGWQEILPDADGFFASQILKQRYRLDRISGKRGEWRYDLVEGENS